MITINQVMDIIFPKLSGVKFRQSYPDTHSGDEFTVINTLGVPRDSIQTIDVNVNCYKKDFPSGIPNLVRLDAMTHAAITALSGDWWHIRNKVHIEFMTSNIFREKELGMHYINLRFKVTYLNN